MGLMPGYKRSDVGVIPDDWDAKPLGSVLSKGRLGGNYANQDAEAELPLMKMGNLARGNFDLSKVQFIKPGVLPEPAHRLVYGDVLFNTRNTLDLVGKVAIWRNEIPVAYYNSNLMRLEFDQEQVCSNEYVNYSLNTESAISRLRRLATGTTSVAAIYTRDLLKMHLIVPPLPEQRAIAMALSDVDALLATLDQMIAKKRDLKQAAMQQLLTGKTRLPGFFGEWQKKTLGVLGATYGGLTGKTKSDFGVGTAKYITFMNVMTNTVIDCAACEQVNVSASETQNRVLRGDLIFNGSSETPEEVAFCSLMAEEVPDLYLNSFCFGFRLFDDQQVDGLFLTYYIRANPGREMMKSLAQGSTRYNLSKTALREASVLLPPIDEQVAIAEVISGMDAELITTDARRDKTRNIKQAMMQELLTGKTRLV